MKASELRIGNWVYITHLLFYKQETEVNIHNLMYLSGEIKEPIEFEIEPIPLTEEWILKFGFQQTDPKKFIGGLYTRKKTDGFYGFYINKETMSYCTFDYEGTIEDIIKIEYVHQLQNIYFALTNEELAIKKGL
jgi:hypothetical protein